ncbi:MAG: hypothetical protein COT74_03195 [Bdellovibrionales bacterium CG10_big_fil_rev_8_21_14_0_10_45_34]|nr:MAG: hypothetical protein COT74_03195 [Bdellovibrionales bacterium CG10_big_fil_rev_8_21_14_0_10_45_34]
MPQVAGAVAARSVASDVFFVAAVSVALGAAKAPVSAAFSKKVNASVEDVLAVGDATTISSAIVLAKLDSVLDAVVPTPPLPEQLTRIVVIEMTNRLPLSAMLVRI